MQNYRLAVNFIKCKNETQNRLNKTLDKIYYIFYRDEYIIYKTFSSENQKVFAFSHPFTR